MVYFVGAGSGAPDLITLRGYRIIENAGVIIYAGSLVNPEVISNRKEDAQAFNSASMTLEDVLNVIKQAEEKGVDTARVHTGDPSIYGAIAEQMRELDALDIKYEVVPGVSSFTASAAALKKEFTLPSVSQTVILTRAEGRTPVPEKENLAELSKHRASMAIFLSVDKIEKVCAQLLVGYPETTPVAVVQKASWEDEKIVIGTLSDIAGKVKSENITKTAQILVGDFLCSDFERSKLYDGTFSHEYRKAEEK